ncbi:MAG: ATP-binding cassette domain-containing protein [Gaiellaceae bacterium]
MPARHAPTSVSGLCARPRCRCTLGRRADLAAILLSRFDLLLLDEPTNDVDFDGLERLEKFVGSYAGALVAVSHDRAFLDRTVDRVVSIEPDTRSVREWTGGWSDYERARDAERAAALERFEQAQLRRRRLKELLSTRRTEARSRGAALGKATGGQDRRATHALETKVRQAERLLRMNEVPVKPFESWELNLSLRAGERLGDQVLALDRAVSRRGAFRLGPIDIDLAPGERLSVSGRNGAGKSTLLGTVPLTAGERSVGRRTVIGMIAQERDAYARDVPLLEEFCSRSGLTLLDARTLTAKFGLGADHVGRSCSTLSPGERTCAHLAELQARGVNLLVLEEPTNHLDIVAVEQLETALAAYDGTLVLVSHDRRFLEGVAPTREFWLDPEDQPPAVRT